VVQLHILCRVFFSFFLCCIVVTKGIEEQRERNPVDFNKLDTIRHQFKGSSSRHIHNSVGKQYHPVETGEKVKGQEM
ncbi:hypothetical protein glysoja_048644, partial [Glycine soja]